MAISSAACWPLKLSHKLEDDGLWKHAFFKASRTNRMNRLLADVAALLGSFSGNFDGLGSWGRRFKCHVDSRCGNYA
jgi:hypothetical protein